MRITIGPERHVFSDGLQPFMLRTDKGTLFVQAQLSMPPGYKPPAKNAAPGLAGCVVSRDNGKTWTRWKPENFTSEVEWYYEGAATTRRDGTTMFVEWVAGGPDASDTFRGRLWESRDDLKTLDGPVPFTAHVPNAKAGFDDNGRRYEALTFHRTLLELPGGDLLASVYGWMKGDDAPVAYQPKMLKFRSMLMRSSDLGRTWRYVSTIASGTHTEEGFNEPTIARIASGRRKGRLVALIRTGSSNQPIHTTHSDDEGATWSPAIETGFTGVDPDLVATRDGTLVGVVGRRNWNDQLACQRYYQIVASADTGVTWQVLGRFGIEPASHTGIITSYAAITPLSPDRFLVVYDIGAWRRNVRYVAQREITLSR